MIRNLYIITPYKTHVIVFICIHMYWNHVLNFLSYAHALPCFTQEVHLPCATLVVPHEAFVWQQVQAVLVCSYPMVVTRLSGRPAGVGKWSPLFHPHPFILDQKVRPAKPNSVGLVVCAKTIRKLKNKLSYLVSRVEVALRLDTCTNNKFICVPEWFCRMRTISPGTLEVGLDPHLFLFRLNDR